MMPWFKFYSEFRYDTKLRRMPIPHRYAFIVLLCLANDNNNRGSITGLDDDDLAFELEMELEDWRTLKAKFRVKGLIDIDGDGSIKIVNWEKRQYSKPSDTPDATRERKRKQRAKAKSLATDDVTPMSREVTPCHATEEDIDQDQDKELEESEENKEAPLSFSESVSVIPDKVQPTEQPTTPKVSHPNQSSVSAAPAEKYSQQPRWRNRPNPDDFFMQAVPEWRVSHKRNDYQEWIMEYIRLKILPLVSQIKPMGDGGKYSSAQVISWLSNCEAKGDLGIGKIESHLEDAKAWWQIYSATKTQQHGSAAITPDHVDRWLLAQAAKGDPVTVTNRLFDNPLDWTVMFDNSGYRAKLRDVYANV